MIFLLILFIFITQISAQCNEGQIDINSASLEELDKITHVGLTTAQRIIDLRPFNSLDDLVEVPYISEGYVEDIKSQGLACVSFNETEGEDELNENEEDINNETDDINVQQLKDDDVSTDKSEETNKIKKPITSEMILLTPTNPKDIKTNNNVLTSDDIAIYGLLGFCILLGILFATRKIRRPRTEFEEK